MHNQRHISHAFTLALLGLLTAVMGYIALSPPPPLFG